MRLNFTLHRWNWCNGCGKKKSVGKYLQVWMYVKSTEEAEEFLKHGTGNGPRKGYTVGSGNIVLSGIV